MRVRRNFDRIYREETDPWSIGDASDPRYSLYLELLSSRVRGGRILDIGCGLGAFLARFASEFDELTGVETAQDAVRRGRELRPEIEFVHTAAERIAETALDARRFDAIVVSDVLYYLRREDRTTVLTWVATHLASGGHALVAGWCPGGRYFEPDEFRALARASLRIVDDIALPSGHVALVARPKRRLAAFTLAPVAGAVTVTATPATDPESVAERVVAALPHEPAPEALRRRRRLERLHLVPSRTTGAPTGDELVAVAAEPTDAARAALERRGFEILSPEELARAAAQGRC